MEDLGAPIAYMALDEGTPVYASDGVQVGTVLHVLADESADVFDGLVIDAQGGGHFVDEPYVADIHERGVVLSIDAAGVDALPRPSENPAVVRVDPSDPGSSELGGKLRRAWDYLSGRY